MSSLLQSMAVDPLDNTADDPTRATPLVLGSHDFTTVTETVSEIAERPRPPRIWYMAFAVTSSLTVMMFAMIGYLIVEGIGVWGLNNPVGWGWAIINFVFWVGIGHAGTLISAILFLLRQKWRTSINRFAEAMTIFAVMCAGIFPAIHVGRIWVVYWLFPVPNYQQMWPNFRSPLLWDVFAVGTYATVSLLFWYIGMVPDLATLRDRARTKTRAIVYGVLALGWRGSHRHWHRYEKTYLILAGLATPLVLSVHSVVSFDFAVSQVPGWHTTIFPPYFVAGAIFSGFAMVGTLLVPVRKWFGLEELITLHHLENMNKIILATGSIVGFAYATEFFIAWYGGNPNEAFAFVNRAFGPYAWAYWIMVSCNVITPQLFWFKKIRTNTLVMWLLYILVNIGMWFERFVITVTSLSRDFLPSSWDYYSPTFVDVLTFLGSFGLFFTLVLLFVRFLPIVAMAEVKSVMPAAHVHGETKAHGETEAVSQSHRDGELQRRADARPAKPAGARAGSGDPGMFGLLIEFEQPEPLVEACRRVRDRGFEKWDAHTPFPIHGMDRAMGIRKTRLPKLIFAGGVTGLATALLIQWWMNAVDYPFLISGKPLFSLPANIPVMFELTILCSALAAFFGLWGRNGLPRLYHPVFKSERFRRATADRFFIVLEAADPRFEHGRTQEFAESLGGVHVQRLES